MIVPKWTKEFAVYSTAPLWEVSHRAKGCGGYGRILRIQQRRISLYVEERSYCVDQIEVDTTEKTKITETITETIAEIIVKRCLWEPHFLLETTTIMYHKIDGIQHNISNTYSHGIFITTTTDRINHIDHHTNRIDRIITTTTARLISTATLLTMVWDTDK